MEYAICTVAAAPVRKEPSHKVEMVNQLLFGETMQVLEVKEEWLRIRSTYDDYEGWLTHHLIWEIDKQIALQPLEYVSVSALNLVLVSGSTMHVPTGSHLTSFHPNKEQLWNENFEYHGSVKNINGVFNGYSIIASAMEWLNAPYLWGGKTIMGVDCSGFVQTVFKLFGIKLYRDAYQQAEQGSQISKLRNVREGDLAFFQNEAGKVIHVGILMNNNKIIHASGKVRIDEIDEEGIINSENGKRTHRLHSIRRM